MIRCHNTFTERRDPNWIEASVALQRLGLELNQGVVEQVSAALQCCRKYKNSRVLVKSYDQYGNLCLFLTDRAGYQQNAPAVEHASLWLNEQQIEYVYSWLCTQSGIMQKAYAMLDSDSPF